MTSDVARNHGHEPIDSTAISMRTYHMPPHIQSLAPPGPQSIAR